MKARTIKRRVIATLAGLALFMAAAGFVAAQDESGRSAVGPTYRSSIHVGGQFEGRAEEAYLASKARISLAQAVQAVAAAHPKSMIVSASLDNENGSLVYSVGIIDPKQGGFQTIVDAGSGTVLADQHGLSAQEESQHDGYGSDERNGSEEGESGQSEGE